MVGVRAVVSSFATAAPAIPVIAALHARDRWPAAICRYVRRVAQRPVLAFFVLFLLCTGLRLALLPLLPIPTPWISDEFSNLLASDTFLAGRLTNPPHPLWRHFETHIVLQLPTYASYRPPGPGLLLALGKVLFDSPWAGVLVSSAVMCSLLYWALSAWIPRFWAFLAGVIAVFNIGLFSYWTNSYWGGSLTAIGGLLVFGATGRLLRPADGIRAKPGMAGVWFGIGLIALALTRPYEGTAFVLGCLIVLAPRFWQTCKNVRFWAAFAIPVLTLGCAVVGWIAYYNYRITGSALQSPYMVGMDRYHLAGIFLWDTKPHPKKWTNREFERFFTEWEGGQLKTLDSLEGKLKHLWKVPWTAIDFFIRPVLLLPIVIYSWKILRSRRMRSALIAGIPLLIAVELAIWIRPDYDAAALAVLYIVMLQGLRYVWALRWRQARIGRHLGIAVVVMAILSPFAWRLHLLHTTEPDPGQSWCCTDRPPTRRSQIKHQLEQIPGKHLVLIRYPADFNIHDEWVYNAPDIDASRIVWARSLDPASDRELLAYYQNRRIWTIDFAKNPYRLVALCQFSDSSSPDLPNSEISRLSIDLCTR